MSVDAAVECPVCDKELPLNGSVNLALRRHWNNLNDKEADPVHTTTSLQLALRSLVSGNGVKLRGQKVRDDVVGEVGTALRPPIVSEPKTVEIPAGTTITPLSAITSTPPPQYLDPMPEGWVREQPPGRQATVTPDDSWFGSDQRKFLKDNPNVWFRVRTFEKWKTSATTRTRLAKKHGRQGFLFTTRTLLVHGHKVGWLWAMHKNDHA